MTSLDWHNLRPIAGARDKGFEALCAQLAEAETPAGAVFHRKGAPDAGVECYTVLPNGEEWAWQSKFFDQLGDSQWSQLDESVKTALTKHPMLARYYVCIPLDRADGRIEGRTSAFDRWLSYVARWQAIANRPIEFVYWGDHELRERLLRPAMAGRLRFWFDAAVFDPEWFTRQVDETLHSTPRYTPELNLKLPLAAEFEALGRTPYACDQLKALVPRLRDRMRAAFRTDSGDQQWRTHVGSLHQDLEAMLGRLAKLRPEPTPWCEVGRIADEAKRMRDGVAALVAGSRQIAPGANEQSTHQRNLEQLHSELRAAYAALTSISTTANAEVLLLVGPAGRGKTHVLCDVARQRITAGRPTVLAMGQRFSGKDDPWRQLLQQLDLPDWTAAEFIGALEAAAIAAGVRALIILDALNEGEGRAIWPAHLDASLRTIARSPWLGVALSVRAGYEEAVVPDAVRQRAVRVEHLGFTGIEDEATTAFFTYYGLELPSVPLLHPEFSNPLFLKLFCSGLRAAGRRHLERGLDGLTQVFDYFLQAVNEKLAKSLSFHPAQPLVRRAVEALALAMAAKRSRMLPLGEAIALVDALLPGRVFETSLYRGMLVEGVLMEDRVYTRDGRIDVTLLAYERFADHIAVTQLLDAYFDPAVPAASLAAVLSAMGTEPDRVTAGALEALCLQIPERCHRELVALEPQFAEHCGLGRAFRESLVWRARADVTPETEALVTEGLRGSERADYLHTLLTLATVPDHSLNANYLHQWLRIQAMPDRDACWSTYLHERAREDAPAHRLVAWALHRGEQVALDVDSVTLYAMALAWCLSASDRFLRDRATKALVLLLTPRPVVLVRWLELFAPVDDPYIRERIYAVAYGAAMRSNNPKAVGSIAQCVYAQVFAGAPARHVLLRDYARGTIERAAFLDAKLDVDLGRVRPPYRSRPLRVPSQARVDKLAPPWESKKTYKRADWAQQRIRSSVLDGDFGRYVLGTNSSRVSRDFLALRLSEPPWSRPPTPREARESLAAAFSAPARTLWEEFEAADAARRRWGFYSSFATDDSLDDEVLARRWEDARRALSEVLDHATWAKFEALIGDRVSSEAHVLTPGYPLDAMQRYIVWRVFDLGWSARRFAEFDNDIVGDAGRSAHKAERIGKKYQWIAYHEFLAFLSDHYQAFDRDEAVPYEGPWQLNARDIDPSVVSTSLGEEVVTPTSWWTPSYDDWGSAQTHSEWVDDHTRLPGIPTWLSIDANGGAWMLADASVTWRAPLPPEFDSSQSPRREVWYAIHGYFIPADDATKFLEWGLAVDFWGGWMPEPQEVHEMFFGEHAWAPASRYFEASYFGDHGWSRPNFGCPCDVHPVARRYSADAQGLDCSVAESFSLHLPGTSLTSALGLHWTGHGADFVDSRGELIAQDPVVRGPGASGLLLERNALQRHLLEAKLALAWSIIGEKRVLTPALREDPTPSLRITGAYVWCGDGTIRGRVSHLLDEPARERR